MAYRNECEYMKSRGDDGNPASGPEIVEPRSGLPGLDSSTSAGFNSQAWLSAEQSMSGMTPSSGGMYDKSGPGGGHGGSSGDNQGTSGSPDGGQPGGLTPNSSCNGGRDGAAESRGHLAPGQIGGSGRNSFRASPISPHQNLMDPGDLGGPTQGTFFGDPANGFAVSSNMNEQQQQQGGFGMANGGWGDMAGQQNMPQVGDGVLRALMNMGPMDAMDLSSWDQGNENMRQ